MTSAPTRAIVADDQIAPATRNLINRHLPTMDHVQALLHLRQAAEGAHSPDIAAALRLEERTVKKALDDLVAGGVVVRESQTGRYRCVPHADTGPDALEELEVLYNTRPVTLVRLIYERPPAALRSFSDAFRLRNPEGDR
jgi:DNA-binding MarR family transcriptional regulator